MDSDITLQLVLIICVLISTQLGAINNKNIGNEIHNWVDEISLIKCELYVSKKLCELWITIYKDYSVPTLTKCTTITLTPKFYYAPKHWRNNDKEPFFVMENGKALTRHYFIYSLKRILTSLGYNSDLYNGHSFRIGASTTAGSKIEDHLIQTLGRWISLIKCELYVSKKLCELWITIYKDYSVPTLTKCTTITLTPEFYYAPKHCVTVTASELGRVQLQGQKLKTILCRLSDAGVHYAIPVILELLCRQSSRPNKRYSIEWFSANTVSWGIIQFQC
jgi:hypothetical protein